MFERRRFLQTSLCAGISYLTYGGVAGADEAAVDAAPDYRLTRDVPTKLFDGKRCWSHPRAGIVRGAGQGGDPRVVMTMNTLDLSGSDVFKGVFGMQTDDLGKSWNAAAEMETLAPRIEDINGQERPVALSDFWPKWHAKTKYGLCGV